LERRRLGRRRPGAGQLLYEGGLAEEPEPGIFRAANAKYRCGDMDRDEVDAELINGPYESRATSR